MLIEKYIHKNLVLTTAFTALTLTAVIWLAQSLRLLELLVDSDAPLNDFLTMLFLSLPDFMVVVIPLALVIATLFTYNKLLVDNELIVMRAAGLSARALYRPLFKISLTLTLLMLLITTYLAPLSENKMADLKSIFKSQYMSFLLRAGVFNTMGDAVTVYVRNRSGNGVLEGILIHDARERDQPPVVITATKGQMIASAEAPRVIVYDGVRQQVDIKTKSLTKLHFKEYTLNLDQKTKEDGVMRFRKLDERLFHELFNLQEMTTQEAILRGQNKTAFISEINTRLIKPLYTMTLPVVAFAILLLGAFNRRGAQLKIWLAVGAVIFLQALAMFLAGSAQKNNLFIVLEYLAVIMPFAVAYAFLDEAFKPRLFFAPLWRRKILP
jgi:lipopolysaccharide export system permease protein